VLPSNRGSHSSQLGRYQFHSPSSFIVVLAYETGLFDGDKPAA
jgi:hypothetical protein